MVSAPLLELTAHPPPGVSVENGTSTPTPTPSPTASSVPMPTSVASLSPAPALGSAHALLAPAPVVDTDSENSVVYVVDGVRMDERSYRIAIATTLALMVGVLQVGEAARLLLRELVEQYLK